MPERANQRGGHRSIGDAHSHLPLPGERGARHEPGRIEHDGVRTGQEPPHQAETLVGDDRVLRHVPEVRAEKRERLLPIAALQEGEALHRLFLERVAAERVVGVGGVGDDPAVLQHGFGALDVARLRMPRVDGLDGGALRHAVHVPLPRASGQKFGRKPPKHEEAGPSRAAASVGEPPEASRSRAEGAGLRLRFTLFRHSSLRRLPFRFPISSRPPSFLAAASRAILFPCSISSRTFCPPL